MTPAQTVERDAAERFRAIGWDDVADGATETLETLEQARGDERLHVLDLGGEVVGFAMTSTLDGDVHLEELDVARAHQGRGFGRALVERVVELARAAGRAGVTLHTFADVPCERSRTTFIRWSRWARRASARPWWRPRIRR